MLVDLRLCVCLFCFWHVALVPPARTPFNVCFSFCAAQGTWFPWIALLKPTT